MSVVRIILYSLDPRILFCLNVFSLYLFISLLLVFVWLSVFPFFIVSFVFHPFSRSLPPFFPFIFSLLCLFVWLLALLTPSSAHRSQDWRLAILCAATHETERRDRSHYTDTDPTSRERVARAGIEPRTSSPKVTCSTDWATSPPSFLCLLLLFLLLFPLFDIFLHSPCLYLSHSSYIIQ